MALSWSTPPQWWGFPSSQFLLDPKTNKTFSRRPLTSVKSPHLSCMKPNPSISLASSSTSPIAVRRRPTYPVSAVPELRTLARYTVWLVTASPALTKLRKKTGIHTTAGLPRVSVLVRGPTHANPIVVTPPRLQLPKRGYPTYPRLPRRRGTQVELIGKLKIHT